MERKVIFAINLTIDGIADHTAVIADDELHDFHTDLLDTVDTILFGRITYELLADFWPVVYDDPRSTASMIRFADKINPLRKIVFSGTLEKADWNNSEIVRTGMTEEVKKIKQQTGKNLSVGGLSVAAELAEHGLIDEFWFLVQPMVAGKGRRLWEGFNKRMELRLEDTRIFKSGVVVLHYINIANLS